MAKILATVGGMPITDTEVDEFLMGVRPRKINFKFGVKNVLLSQRKS